jgi:hypothetical protein
MRKILLPTPGHRQGEMGKLARNKPAECLENVSQLIAEPTERTFE